MSPVLALYRQLLRIARKWPIDTRRPGRIMQPVLLEQTKAAFRRNRLVTDPIVISELVTQVSDYYYFYLFLFSTG